SEIGLIYLRRGDFDRGIEHLRSAVRSKPDYAPAHFNLSLALRHVGEFEESLRHAEEVLRINPDFPRGRRLRDELVAARERAAGSETDGEP
ncbi:MAG: tetratricopeptide repeat protein, partial [Candidatus Eisenbacteria bacterium]|nr:tetratricopeptide repeat protein [Candidatus Eisenbacteria bacterium]